MSEDLQSTAYKRPELDEVLRDIAQHEVKSVEGPKRSQEGSISLIYNVYNHDDLISQVIYHLLESRCSILKFQSYSYAFEGLLSSDTEPIMGQPRVLWRPAQQSHHL